MKNILRVIARKILANPQEAGWVEVVVFQKEIRKKIVTEDIFEKFYSNPSATNQPKIGCLT